MMRSTSVWGFPRLADSDLAYASFARRCWGVWTWLRRGVLEGLWFGEVLGLNGLVWIGLGKIMGLVNWKQLNGESRGVYIPL
jgi:hypothetical protein